MRNMRVCAVTCAVNRLLLIADVTQIDENMITTHMYRSGVRRDVVQLDRKPIIDNSRTFPKWIGPWDLDR